MMPVSKVFWQKTSNAASRREAVMVFCRDYQFSERRDCGLIGISRSGNRYRRKPDRHARLCERLLAGAFG